MRESFRASIKLTAIQTSGKMEGVGKWRGGLGVFQDPNASFYRKPIQL